jgi:hypothetical protein
MLDERFLKQRLPGLVAQLEKEENSTACLRRLSGDLASLLLRTIAAPEICRKNENGCKRQRDAVSRAFALLHGIEGLRPYLKGESLVNDSQNFCNEPIEEIFKTLRALETQAKKAANCIDLKPPAAGVDSSSSSSIVTTAHSAYTLTRLPDDREGQPAFKASLNLGFQGVTPNQAQEWRKRAQECFDGVKGRLKNEAEGSLEIAIYSKTELIAGIPIPPAQTITVGDKIVRSGTNSWASSADCATIIHETLHHLGLEDEYRETAIGYLTDAKGATRLMVGADELKSPVFDCRAIGPVDSIMRDPEVALATPAVCNAQSTTGCLSNRVSLPLRKNLLYPAQFRAIIHPGCYTANRLYYLCTSETRKTSPKGGGATACGVGIPEECKNPNEWLK